VQLLLDSGAPKDQRNSLGWTALHEACFFNRIETVKTLLLSGCRADIRTNTGALPYHLASLRVVREMLEDMGGPGAKPSGAGDSVDMVTVLRELTSFGGTRYVNSNVLIISNLGVISNLSIRYLFSSKVVPITPGLNRQVIHEAGQQFFR
jgi:hypothetical protein